MPTKPQQLSGAREVSPRQVVACLLLGLGVVSCGPLDGIEEKPCRPGCVDDHTRLFCDERGAPHSEPCPASSEPCATTTCTTSGCGFTPAVGAACGPSGLAHCNEGFACLGPDVKLTSLSQHVCALADDGRIWCWGDNTHGQLGNGGPYEPHDVVPGARWKPSLVRRLPGKARDVSAGYAHTCAVLEGGEVYCWGHNKEQRVTPLAPAPAVIAEPTRVDVPGVRFSGVSAGWHHTCALAEDGTVYCWGSTVTGQCGVDGGGAGDHNVTPKRIPAIADSNAGYLDKVRLIAAGANHTCAVRTANPTLVCWGSNRNDISDSLPPDERIHKLGPNATHLDYSPVPIPINLGVVLGVGMSFEATFALSGDGSTYAWGLNTGSQLGIGRDDVAVAEPSPVLVFRASSKVPLRNVAEVNRTHGSGNCARLNEPLEGFRYACWGTDSYGELGFGVSSVVAPTAMPLVVLPPELDVTSLVQGEGHACATVVGSIGVEIWCYGRFIGTPGVNPTLVPTPLDWEPNSFRESME